MDKKYIKEIFEEVEEKVKNNFKHQVKIEVKHEEIGTYFYVNYKNYSGCRFFDNFQLDKFKKLDKEIVINMAYKEIMRVTKELILNNVLYEY